MKDPAYGRRFTAELELCELDSRKRTGASWPARATAISHSRLWLRSRRMCYLDAKVVTKIHHVDDQPLILVGVVLRCEYDTDGMYDIELGLEAVQNREALGKPRPVARSRVMTAARA